MKDWKAIIERMAGMWIELGGDAQDFRDKWWDIADRIKEINGDEDEE